MPEASQHAGRMRPPGRGSGRRLIAGLLVVGCSFAGLHFTQGAARAASSVQVAGTGSQQNASLATCTPAGLRLVTNRIGSQTGEQGREFELTNRSADACRLLGYPKLAFYSGRHRLAFRILDGGGYVSARRPRPVVLAPGAHAYFLAAKFRCDVGKEVSPTTIHVTLARGGRSVTVGPGGANVFVHCQPYPGDAGEHANRIDVSPIVATRSAEYAQY
ncbi:MAG: DUF4232 domain-containing protein [Actinomycetota bacterium]|nr:DUF4232 domain-containing protein [Actinomycetota bacterium]